MARPRRENPFIGRAHDLDALLADLSAVPGGAGQAVIIEGEAGIGKTRLVDEVVAHVVEHRGWVVARGACEEMEGTRPLGPLADALGCRPDADDPFRAEIGRILAGTASEAIDPTLPGPNLAYRAIECLIDALEADAARHGSVLLVIEDVHWADGSTVRALRAVVRGLPHLAVALIVTTRPHPRPPSVAAFFDVVLAGDGRHMRLDPLPDDVAQTLAGALLDARPGRVLADQIRGAGGNPLYIVELLAALEDERAIERNGGVADTNSGPCPPSLRLTILRRLSFLPDETLTVLRVASILGTAFALEDVAAVANRTSVDLVSLLDPVVVAGLLVDAGQRLAFRHDLIRDAIYHEMPTAFRTALHLEAGRALAGRNAPAGQVAEHLVLGASPGDTQAVEWLRTAARQSMYLDPSVAVRLLERALELLGPSDPDRPAVAAELVMPMVQTGLTARAHAMVGEILAQDPDATVAYLLRRAVAYSLLIGAGPPAAAIEAYRELTALGPPADLARDWSFYHSVDLTNRAMAELAVGDVAAGRATAEESRRLADAAGSNFAVCLALLPAAFLASGHGDVVTQMELSSYGMQLADASPSAELGNLWSHFLYGIALMDADRLDKAERVLAAGRALVEAQGRLAQLPFYSFALALVKTHRGAWGDAERDLDGVLAASEQWGTGAGLDVVSARALAAFLAFHRGDHPSAATQLAAMEGGPTGIGLGVDAAFLTQALLLEAQGDERAAVTILSAMWNAIPELRFLSGTWRWTAPELVRLALTTGDRAIAEAVVEEVVSGAARASDVASAAGAALRCRGLLDDDADVLLDAVAALRTGPRPFDLAATCADAAASLGRVGRLAEATALFSEAHEAFEVLGARHDAARTAAAMRAAGIRRGARQARRRPATGWPALTDTERRVAALVAESLTNAEIAKRLFVSRHTIESHLKHAFVKLGIRSRVELATAAAREQQ